MHEVDRVIAQRLDSGVPLVAEVSRYIISAGGKRLRPALLLLTCGALGYKGAQRFNLAAVVEFIHTATLLHDDVVDDSVLRRGNATANETFGNPASVLVGDFLYSRAFQMMVDAKNMRIMQVLADATNVIAEGEVLQLMNMHDPDLSVEDYLRVIRFKTAKLFEASARIGAVLADALDQRSQRIDVEAVELRRVEPEDVGLAFLERAVILFQRGAHVRRCVHFGARHFEDGVASLGHAGDVQVEQLT